MTPEARLDEALQETLDRLRLEVAELRASRKRLVLAADADRRRIEHDLHDGVQQQLVALAVNLQLAGRLADTDPVAAKALLEEMGRDVQQAMEATAQVAHRLYPPLLEAGGLASALRAAVVSSGIRAVVRVNAAGPYRPEVAGTVYLCCLEALELVGADGPATVTVRDEDGALVFEVFGNGAGSGSELDGLRDRVEALGGRLAIGSRAGAGAGTRVSGSVPVSR